MNLPVYMSSRRTIMDGEVVTFATGFKEKDGAFGPFYEATGSFEISASRDAVMVHRACTATDDAFKSLMIALALAEAARVKLAPTRRYGAPSMFPSKPTLCE